MKTKYFIFCLFLMLFTSCGIDINIKQKTPIEVDHKVIFDDTAIRKYMEYLCKKENPYYSQEELDACVNTKYEEFLLTIYNG